MQEIHKIANSQTSPLFYLLFYYFYPGILCDVASRTECFVLNKQIKLLHL